jgi:hypothetical protein
MDKELEYWIEYWMFLKKKLIDFRRWNFKDSTAHIRYLKKRGW